MVQLKVTDGRSTRKFSLEPGKDSYQQLEQTLVSFFPESVKEDQEMQLRYRDSDGDLITVTTDSEFQEVLAQLPPLNPPHPATPGTPQQATPTLRKRWEQTSAAHAPFLHMPTHACGASPPGLTSWMTSWIPLVYSTSWMASCIIPVYCTMQPAKHRRNIWKKNCLNQKAAGKMQLKSSETQGEAARLWIVLCQVWRSTSLVPRIPGSTLEHLVAGQW